ncbi:MAG: N-6 DNA methylase [Bradymonadaceae bacterium]|nr:N-6 DNA methylase [Lujinxingiaceae bacterium]
MNQDVARFLAGVAGAALGEAFDRARPQASVRAALAPILESSVLEQWLVRVEASWWSAANPGPLHRVAEHYAQAQRRLAGMYLTPPWLADAMAATLESWPGGAVIDLSAGGGALLVAAAARMPGLQAVGVELRPGLAIAAALALFNVRRTQSSSERHGLSDRIYVADGLSHDGPWVQAEAPITAVLGNPPYVGEKGNRALFDAIKRDHRHMARWFGPRMDLLYLFFHRALDLLEPGGRLIFLTSEYWLTASGAAKLRDDLATRTTAELFATFDARLFADAPGHHSLLSVFRRGVGQSSVARALRVQTQALSTLDTFLEDALAERPLQRPGVDFNDVDPFSLRASRWTPFVDGPTVLWARRLEAMASPLHALAQDYQGFVSGADRVTRRHVEILAKQDIAVRIGDPIFMFHEHEIPQELVALKGLVFRPVLRGSAIRANALRVEATSEEFALYLDRTLSAESEAIISGHLAKFRGLLELRREVREGTMAWYRLHWPRRRADYSGPKLVVPRRAPRPCFCLDLSASVVSSDCTYLVAPPDTKDPVRYLTALMFLLNGANTARYLQAFGKRKGQQIEFYSEPLRALPISACRVDGELRLLEELWVPELIEAFWHEVDSVLDAASRGQETCTSVSTIV